MPGPAGAKLRPGGDSLRRVGGEPRIMVIRDGPYLVTGGVPLIRLARDQEGRWAEGEVVEDGRLPYVLCRCGRTKRQPRCDNRHSEAVWDLRRTLIGVPRPVSWEVPSSAPCIAIKPNGPLRVLGVGIETSDHAEMERADRYSLCRCGRSHTMPFCDGTHKDVGFRG